MLYIDTYVCGLQNRIYFNDWAVDGPSQDSERSEDMVFAETELALELHMLQREFQKQEAGFTWSSAYADHIRTLIEDERKATFASRRRAFDEQHPPSSLLRLHQHRRHLASLQQELQLIQQAISDMENGMDILDPCIYLKHAIQSGSAIITGARYV